MPARSIVLVRHGRTAYNAELRLQGQIDIELDVVGRWQAGTSAQALGGLVVPARILTSDLSRAVDTAKALNESHNVEVVIDKRIRERSFGPWEGLTAEQISASWPDQYTTWRGGGEPDVDGIERKSEVSDRMCAAILEHSESMSDSQTLLVVSHGAAISCAIAGLLGHDASQWRGVSGMSNVHWSRLSRNTAAGAHPLWRLEQHNAGPSITFGKKAWENGPADIFAAL